MVHFRQLHGISPYSTVTLLRRALIQNAPERTTVILGGVKSYQNPKSIWGKEQGAAIITIGESAFAERSSPPTRPLTFARSTYISRKRERTTSTSLKCPRTGSPGSGCRRRGTQVIGRDRCASHDAPTSSVPALRLIIVTSRSRGYLFSGDAMGVEMRL